MKLCEIVRADKTAADALLTAAAVAKRIRKTPVVVGVCHGFVGNRMLAVRGLQGEALLKSGALPEQVDAVITRYGLPMGPFAMGDLAGLDIGWRSRQDRGIRWDIADAICEAGRLGQKTSKGYYRYEAGSRAPISDPEVEKIIDDTCRRLGLTRRAIGDQEILERMIYPMINEGARILEEDIAARPERHRRDLALRVWMADPPRRSDVLCRPGWPEAHRRAARILCRPPQRAGLETGRLCSLGWRAKARLSHRSMLQVSDR